jgi:hypothetical protein
MNLLAHKLINQNIMKKHYCLIFNMVLCTMLHFSVFSQCEPPMAVEYLDINNISAPFRMVGSHFFTGDVSKFEVPKGSGKTSLFAGSLWMGGMDAAGDLYLAAMLYRQKGNDYWGGPVSSNSHFVSPKYDKFWKISKAEIEYHKLHYTDSDYIMPENIATWPAHGNTNDHESKNLAPFVNVSGNSSYTPLQGDYPLIRGDQALFWINNDICATHTESGGRPLSVEILCMAYAYNSPNEALQNTIFLSYEIRNRSNINYYDFYIGFFADFDIGNSEDDYIGCDMVLNLSYGYNGNEIDEGKPWAYGAHPPAQGVMFLNQKMNAFAYFSNEEPENVTADPQNATEYYNYMQAKWKDGTPLTYGGTGYNPNSTQYTKFAFSGDPVTQIGWSEVLPNGPGSTPNAPSDRRGMMSTGPFTFPFDASICIDIAFPFARDLEGNHISSVASLKQRAQAIQQFYNSQHYPNGCALHVGIKENKENSEKIQIYPNPCTGEFTITNYELRIMNVELFDVYGRKQLSHTSYLIPHTPHPTPHTTVNVSHLSPGIYFYRVALQDGSVCLGKVVVL